MTEFLESFPQLGPRPSWGRPLGGSSTVWTAALRPYGRTEPRTPATLLSKPQEARICELRAPIAGLSMDRPRIMGILNVTPDSFSDGGDLLNAEAATLRAREMAQAADILDIGGESTRPGADEVPVDVEIARTAPVIAAIRAAGVTTPISIDTRKSAVAEAALEAGADIVNDVSAMTFDPGMAPLVAERRVPICLMHALADPKTMQQDPQYNDVVQDVASYLASRIRAARRAGIERQNIIVDPGIGFGKTLQHNVSLLRHLSVYHDLGCAILLGASRKRFIGTIGKAEAAKERMPGSLAVALHGAAQGVQILRVHDVNETRQALRLHLAINEANEGEQDA